MEIPLFFKDLFQEVTLYMDPSNKYMQFLDNKNQIKIFVTLYFGLGHQLL